MEEDESQIESERLLPERRYSPRLSCAKVPNSWHTCGTNFAKDTLQVPRTLYNLQAVFASLACALCGALGNFTHYQ